MNENLWDFSNPSQLSSEPLETPDTILKEQMEQLKRITEGVIVPSDTIYTLSKRRSDNADLEDYSFAHEFYLTVPTLDHYRKVFLTLYTRDNAAYPVALSDHSYLDDFNNEDSPNYVCSDKEDFSSTLKSYFASSDTKKLLRILYQKAQTVGTLNA